jgi:tRNA threonylcarbamoyladenosine biosynthesis protein TsaB
VRILGFDTATPATAVALWDDTAGLEVGARDDPPAGKRPRHTSRLMPLIVEVLERGSTSWEEIDRIAVGIGPGTFTGLRIGIATARALAQARSIPLVGVSTLRSLARGAGRQGLRGDEAVLAAIDARRGEIFAAAWRETELDRVGGATLLAPCALAPQALGEVVARLGPAVLAVGDGAVKFRQVLEPSGASIPEDDSDLHKVSAINHCRLGAERSVTTLDEIQPEYLRRPDAELARDAAQNR